MSDQQRFEDEIQALATQIANIGAHVALDRAASMTYAQQIGAMANELRSEANTHRITWAQAADKAQTARHAIVDVIRSRDTPVGRAMARKLRREGKTLDQIIARKVELIYGSRADFKRLSVAQQHRFFSEIVDLAGMSNPTVKEHMHHLPSAGRGLLFAALALSIFQVANVDEKPRARCRRVTTTADARAGSEPAARQDGDVRITVGEFVCGALAAFLVSARYDADWINHGEQRAPSRFIDGTPRYPG